MVDGMVMNEFGVADEVGLVQARRENWISIAS